MIQKREDGRSLKFRMLQYIYCKSQLFCWGFVSSAVNIGINDTLHRAVAYVAFKESHFLLLSELRLHVTPNRPCSSPFQPLRADDLSKPNICFSIQCNYSVCYWGQMVVNRHIINVADHSFSSFRKVTRC